MNKTILFACRTLESEISAILPPGVDCEYLEYALHNTPEKLRSQLKEKIAAATDYETILLGYGLCSNSIAGLTSPHQTIVVPRAHDCIMLLLGSREKYNCQFKEFPGTYYLSRGWLEQEGDPLSSYYRSCEKYGEENARYVIEAEYANYQRIVFIHTPGATPEDVAYSKSVAEFLQVAFEEMPGSLDIFEKLVSGNWDKREFVINPPGRIITANAFM